MVSIEEARRQIQQQQQEVQDYQDKLRKQKEQLSTQRNLRTSGLTGRTQRAGTLSSIDRQSRQLGEVSNQLLGQLNEVNKAEADYQAQIQAEETRRAQFQIAQRVFSGELPRTILSQLPKDIVIMAGGSSAYYGNVNATAPDISPDYNFRDNTDTTKYLCWFRVELRGTKSIIRTSIKNKRRRYLFRAYCKRCWKSYRCD